MLRVYVWFTGFLALISSNSAVKMIADLSEKGVKGSVQISQPTPDNDITIEIFTESNIRPRMLTWKILETPKDLSKAQKCIDINPEEYIDLERFFGKIPVPGEKSFSMRKGSKLDMFQNDTIFGKALVIGEGFICSNFRMENGAQVELAKAEFKQPKVSGLVFFRMVTIGFRTHTLMYTDLFDSWNDPPTTSDHAWQLYYADPNANDQDRISGCEFLKAPAADDFSSTVGKIRVAGNSEPDSRKQFTLGDFSLPIGSRSLYLVLRDDKNPTDILACAEILPDYPRQSITVFGSSGVKGTITFEQRDPFSLTKISSDIEGLKKRAGDYHVHEYPLRTIDTCKGAGGHFNPTSVKTEQLPPPGVGTNDQYEFGDISGKHGTLRGLDFLRGELWDHSMPLWGKHSIQGRSLMIHDAFTGAGWVCANIIISSKSGQTKPRRTNKPKPARIRRPIVSTRIGTMEPGSYDGVNKLINLEMEASLALMNMAAYFDRADVSLKGVAGFFREASKKEMEFVWQLIDYLNLRGEGVAPITPKGSSSNNWTSPLEAMEEALDLQNSIDQSLNSLVNDGNDYKLASFLDSNFLQAKTRSISLLMTYVTQLQRVGSGLGEFEFDKTLLQSSKPK